MNRFHIVITSFIFIVLSFIPPVSAQTCTDNDGDGFAIEGGACGEADCDDADPEVYPGRLEICDGKDSNCDGYQSFVDRDKDGDGIAWCAGDCNDNDPGIYPGAPEVCDGIDNDCNGILRPDEHDSDNDGYLICGINPDCNDYDAFKYPGATEICTDNKDNDCDGLIDSDDPDAVDCITCTDSDGDGYHVEGGLCGSIDCNDTDPFVYPGALELCDGVDNDCNSVIPVDERDIDGDGYIRCGFSADCDDKDASVNPDAFEICDDGIDNNCNGLSDYDDKEFCIDNCIDRDLDGYRDAACGGSDCDDSDANIFPTDLGICDGLYSNCTGFIKLVWHAPTANVDGTELTDLAGYKVYYRTASNNYSESINVGNLTCHAITHLSPGIWCFALTAYDTSWNESDFSDDNCITVE